MKPAPFTRFCSLTGLVLTAGQLAFASVAYDGREPAELTGETRERARRIFGAIETVPRAARAVIVQKKGRDGGGTRMGATRLVHLAVTLPLDRIGESEVAYCFLGAPKLRLARTAKRFALEVARALAEAGDITIENETADGFTIVRHDGRRVRLECFAAARGGDNARGVPVIGVLLDEAAFYRDESTGIVNDRDIFNAIVPRLLPGGQILIVSSPWGTAGLLAEEFFANHGAPVTCLAADCPTLVMRDDPETADMVERERARDSENARREFDAEFLTDKTAAFIGAHVLRAFEPREELFAWGQPQMWIDAGERVDSFTYALGSWGEPDRRVRYKQAVPPPSSGLLPGMLCYPEVDSNGFPIIIRPAERPILNIFAIGGWAGSEVAELGMDRVTASLAGIAKDHGCRTIVGDQRGAPFLAALLSHHGVNFKSYTWTNESKHEAVNLLRSWLRDRELLVTDHAETKRQFQNYRRTVMPGGGFRYGAPNVPDDYVATLITAAHQHLEERGTTTEQQHVHPIQGAPTRRTVGGRHMVTR